MEQAVHPLRWIGRKLARHLSESRDDAQVTTSHPDQLAATLRKGDVLLVEGTSRFASAISYVTQSTWSHAALFAGDALGMTRDGENRLFSRPISMPACAWCHLATMSTGTRAYVDRSALDTGRLTR